MAETPKTTVPPLTVEDVPAGSIMMQSNGAGRDAFMYRHLSINTYRLVRSLHEGELGYLHGFNNVCYDDSDTRTRFSLHFSRD
jgi:hypothetical protein